MPLLKFIFRSARLTFGLVLVMNIVSGVSTVVMLLVINRVLTHMTFNGALVGAFVGSVILLLGARSVSAYFAFELTQSVILHLRSQLASIILRAPLVDLERIQSSTLLSAFTEDVNVVIGALPGIPALTLNVAILTGCWVFMFWLAPPVGIIALGLLSIISCLYYVLTKRAGRHFVQAQHAFDMLFGYFRALTDGIKELKLHYHRRLAYYRDVFIPETGTYRTEMLHGTALHYIAHMLMYTIIFLAIGGILAGFASGHYGQTAIGLVILLLFIGPPIETILLWIPAFSRANIALNHLQALTTTLSQSNAEPDTTPDPVKGDWQTLQLQDVTFTYPATSDDLQFTLGPINLHVTSGEIVFLVGGNGSGKSTLVKLLCGLYYPTTGQICFDNVPIDQTNREWYRQHFSVTFADIFLFDQLVGFDIPYLDHHANHYLAKLRLDTSVTMKDGRFSTTALSRGQRKRLALLVAYLEDRPLYIFDEWAADQDPTFKQIFYTEVLPELKASGKTVLVVTHDQFFTAADRVIRLEDGCLVDWHTTSTSVV